MSKSNYSDYCTAWYLDGEVIIYDEITDKFINRIQADEETGKKILADWKANAPKNCICDLI
ncbi:MAG: hypothetical protein PHC95_05000 [Parabacteroides sp.]|nr:hypothetical protein [Parabacteroides sp.]